MAYSTIHLCSKYYGIFNSKSDNIPYVRCAYYKTLATLRHSNFAKFVYLIVNATLFAAPFATHAAPKVSQAPNQLHK